MQHSLGWQLCTERCVCKPHCIAWFTVDCALIIWFSWLFVYSATVCSCAWLNEWMTSLYRMFWLSTEVVYLKNFLVVTWLVPVNSLCSVCTIQLCISLQCHFIWSHICWVHVCLAVTFHLHFEQNDQDVFCATSVTQGWSVYPNTSQHKKLTLEKKIILLLLQGLKPMTIQTWVWHLTTELFHAPCHLWY